MKFSLRQLSRSRRLRAMGALAWLMLVVQSLTAMPMSVDMHQPSHHHRAVHSMSGVMGASCHRDQAAATSNHCCDEHGACDTGPADNGCSCAAVTSTALPSAELLVLRSSLAGTIYATQQDSGAPSLSHGPPLRPPAV